jgi:DNA-binding NarL/FixJ family response regulator
MSINVFLADDHAVVRDGLRFLLEAEGDIQVVGDAANGRDAVRLVSELRPDIVILDIAMPELNGIEAAKQIREIDPSIQIIMLSMYSSAEHVFRALQAGARGYLLKESGGTDVVQAVRTVLAGRRYLSEEISEGMIDDYIRQRKVVEAQSPLAQLSSREQEILQLVVEGKSSAEIAEALFLSPKTVGTYRSRVMRKLGVDDLPGLVKFAILHGLTPLE